MSNTGGAWDNAKKFIEKATPGSDLQGKGSEIHKVRPSMRSQVFVSLGLPLSVLIEKRGGSPEVGFLGLFQRWDLLIM